LKSILAEVVHEERKHVSQESIGRGSVDRIGRDSGRRSNQDGSFPKGTLSPSTQYTTRNYGNRRVRIYTPPGYSETRAEKYPVLYLHHGIDGNENAWTSSEGNADKVMNYLYAQSNLKVTPMIIVMPFGNMEGTSGDTWGNYEDVLLKDLIPFVEKYYNASSDPNMRAMAGLSWGGGQTLTYTYRHMDVFTWIGGFSPAPNSGTPSGNIKDIPGVKAKVHLNYFAGGTKSGGGGFDETGFLATSRSFHNFLVQNGVTNAMVQAEEGLGHEAENWNRQLYNFAQRIFKFESSAIMTLAPSGSDDLGRSHRLIITGSGAKVQFGGGSERRNRIFGLDGRMMNPFGNLDLHTLR
jgi:enterochelin esterase-like enzyme